MSGLEILAVVSCVAAVCSAYHDGTELIHQIKERRKAKKALREAASPDATTQELELSLTRGQDVVRSQYDRDFRRMGEAFAIGDQEARDTLKDIIIHLQGQVISNLKIAWQQDTQVDFLPLQDVSDDSQDRAILCLMQLHQRLLIAAPISLPINHNTARPPNGFQPGFIEPLSRESTWAIQSNPNSVSSPQNLSVTPQPRRVNDTHARQALPLRGLPEPMTPRQQSWAPLTPPQTISRNSTASSEPEKRKPSRLGPFRRSKEVHDARAHAPEAANERAEPLRPPTPPHDPLTDGTMLAGLGLGVSNTRELEPDVSRMDSVSTGSSISLEPDNPAFNPWSDTAARPPHLRQSPRESYASAHSHRSSLVPDALVVRKNTQSSDDSRSQLCRPDPLSSHRTSRSSQYSQQSSNSNPMSIRRISQISSTPQSISQSTIQSPAPGVVGQLPLENNNFAGFCKGAWRLQIGEKKKALDERQKPGGMYVTMMAYWKCTKCRFEGRMGKDAKGKSCTDQRIFGSNGILYRWEFLFKSHVQLKDSLPNPLNSTFGCIFCCAEGNGTPIIGGVQNFMAHLQEHRARPPTGEVLYRIKCIIGRQPEAGEDFDIVLPPL